MENTRMKDALYVRELLSHQRLEDTLIYARLVSFKSDDYVCRVAKTVEDASMLIEASFES